MQTVRNMAYEISHQRPVHVLLSWFYPNLILYLFWFHFDFVPNLSWKNYFIQIIQGFFSRFFQNFTCPYFIHILSDLNKRPWTALKRMTFDFLTTLVALNTKYFFMLFFSLLFENAPYDFYGLFFITVWKCPYYSLEKCKGLKWKLYTHNSIPLWTACTLVLRINVVVGINVLLEILWKIK